MSRAWLKVEGGGFPWESRRIGFPRPTPWKENRQIKRTNKKPQSASARLNIVTKQNEDRLRACFAENSQLLLPMLDLLQNTRASINELMHEAGRGLVEQLLVISATEVAGEKHPGRKGGEIRWHGSQQGQIVMDERKLSVKRPRLRHRDGGEVPVPAYEQLNENPRLGERMHEMGSPGQRLGL
jgi:hypothetical protein